ncbi:pyridoxal-phosphate dependent enzyme [Streptomyces profundus]|uniref:pyridoxal-phosphate dependent enzyme n=1 Tax=Streptomyces profundus TaxID=2867410 RepID=UPI001D165A95|nr:pyridoxal-phosphate dependent enzyme [Streptomyces sp. MA3_2.13]UED83100.1 pyridoxal-phosphate dependent enzyme [Streptomyces sp. MA3_2.13]
MTRGGAMTWAVEAVARLRAEAASHGPTPLRALPLPAFPDIEVHLKDESAQPTGSVKHRLVRALYHRAIAGGHLGAGVPVVVGTAGAVAVAGAYFARLLGLPFTAVVPRGAPPAVRARIEREGGRWQLARQPPAALGAEAASVARDLGGHLLDHFAEATPALAEHGGPSLAEEVLSQLRDTAHPTPRWLVTGAGTGATSATCGRHLRAHSPGTRLAVVDPEHSAYFPGWASDCADYATGMPSRIPGIGRPRIEPGFTPSVIDLVLPVPDGASVAAMRWLDDRAGLAVGPAAGTGLWGACQLVRRMAEAGESGSVVTVAGDGAAPYRRTHLDAAWLAKRGLDPTPYEGTLERFATTGEWRATP